MSKTKRTEGLLVIGALAVLAGMGFAAQRAVPFMMDDEWYGTNLVTGAPLTGLGDVVESQVWHFMNWGGRCITHGLLQLTLMSGELWADILNLIMTLFLTAMICLTVERRGLMTFLQAHAMIYALSANLKMSMLWQAGAVNYIYSSAWILLFMLPYLRSLRDSERRPMAGAAAWLLPLGLMAGWSNENMGPVCFLLALGTVIDRRERLNRRPEGWMVSGMISSLAGSILVVAAPGNFVRSAVLPAQTLYDRFFSMLTAGADYLLPSVLAAVLLLLVKTVCLKRRPDRVQWALAAMAVLSYGAMVLSPHYPDRATFGTMVLCIALSVSLLADIGEAETGNRRVTVCIRGWTAVFWLCAVGKLAAEIFHLV